MKFCPCCGTEIAGSRVVFCMERGNVLPENPRKQMVKSGERNIEAEPPARDGKF